MKTTITLFLLLVSGLLFSQTIAEQVKNEMIEDWKRAKEFTLEYIEAMPEDKINFKANDEVRSFANQLLHLSQGTIGLSSNGAGIEPIYAGINLEEQEEYKNKESLTKIVTEAYDFAINAVTNMDMSTSGEVVTRGPYNVTRLGWLKKSFEHQTHHRGQCTIYLRLAGVTPPNAKLF